LRGKSVQIKENNIFLPHHAVIATIMAVQFRYNDVVTIELVQGK